MNKEGGWGQTLLTATQSFCILHIIKHAVHTFCVIGKGLQRWSVSVFLGLLSLFYF